MKKGTKAPHIFNSVSELHKALGFPAPLHPLISLNDYKDIKTDITDLSKGLVTNLYKISYKKSYTGRVRYGQEYYDFDEGGICFVSPGQFISQEEPLSDFEGFTLMIHPDFIRNYPLGRNIRNYGFFSYTSNEALHLSEKEKETIMGVFKSIRDELELPIDQFSQDVVISLIELLLNYSNRYYNRQFITRKAGHNNLLVRMENSLNKIFDTENALISSLPTVQQLAGELNVSPRYLSDMLRVLTGQSAQQHIHDKLIEKAKEILSSTDLTIGEVAYRLGFEHPQSFHKLFKRKTNVSPVEFRQSFQQN